MASIKNGNAVNETVPFIMVLSGKRRGHCEPLERKTIRIVIVPDLCPQFLESEEKQTQEYHATLHRVSNTYEISVSPGHDVWVNGEKITGTQLLKSGDLLELGQGGPVVRYRLYPAGHMPVKSLNEVVIDSLNGAQADGATTMGKTSRFMTNMLWNLATQTTLWFRIWVVIVLTILIVSFVMLVSQNIELQKRVASENVRISEIEKLMKEYGSTTLDQKDLLQLQEEVRKQLGDTFERLGALEAGSGKAARVIAEATPSVVLLLGSFIFFDPYSGQYLHIVETKDGISRFSMANEGRIMELAFTGTGFAVSGSGLILTNRHVIEFPENDPRTEFVKGRELVPKIMQIIAYFPGMSEPVFMEPVDEDRNMDLLLLRPIRELKGIKPLIFDTNTPKPGDEVFLLGYPLGINAMVARASNEMIKSLTSDGKADFWTVAQGLSEAGYIKPLATRGIVGQVSDDFVVYDAETTFGGSGGPLLNIDGRVIAINSAIIPDFGGSNMGILVNHTRKFLKIIDQENESE